MKRAIFNWSGGKDSALCLHHSLKNNEFEIRYLVTALSETYNRISMHGVRRELLLQQAKNIGIELKEILLPEPAPLDVYDKIMYDNLIKLKEEGIDYSIFGDINLADLREYRENRLLQVDMKGIFPLWDRPTSELLKEFLELGFKTVVVCVNEKYLNKSFAGRVIDEDFINDLPANVDPCGENGEFHSFVFDGPIFSKPVNYSLGSLVFKEYKPEISGSDSDEDNKGVHDTRFWYQDILLK